jgi:hypothetical protein
VLVRRERRAVLQVIRRRRGLRRPLLLLLWVLCGWLLRTWLPLLRRRLCKHRPLLLLREWLGWRGWQRPRRPSPGPWKPLRFPGTRHMHTITRAPMVSRVPHSSLL